MCYGIRSGRYHEQAAGRHRELEIAVAMALHSNGSSETRHQDMLRVALQYPSVHLGICRPSTAVLGLSLR